MMFHGMGDNGDGSFTVDGTQSSGDGSYSVSSTDYTVPDYSGSTSYPTGSSSATTPSGNPSSGFNWGIFSTLLGVAGQTAGKVITSETQAQTAQQMANAQLTAAQAKAVSNSSSLSSYLPLLLIGGGVLLIMNIKKGSN